MQFEATVVKVILADWTIVTYNYPGPFNRASQTCKERIISQSTLGRGLLSGTDVSTKRRTLILAAEACTWVTMMIISRPTSGNITC